jgi:nucleoside-diphosphate-sugar epimerase
MDKKLKVLVTGATGFVGRYLVTFLESTGYDVRCAVRNRTTAVAYSSRDVAVIGEINDKTDWRTALSDVDVVIHLAGRAHVMNEKSADAESLYDAVNVNGTANLLDQLQGTKVKRLIYLSSVKVNGERTKPGERFTEESKCNPEDIYGRSKLKAEQAIWAKRAEAKIEYVVIRPPLVYGPNVKGNLATLVNVLRKGVPVPLGMVNNKRSLVSLQNLSRFIEVCIRHPDAANQVFFISDDEDVSTTYLVEQIGKALDKSIHNFPVPVAALRALGVLVGRGGAVDRLTGTLQVDISKGKKLLGWAPAISLGKGLELMIREQV